jgi:hypothetical protein
VIRILRLLVAAALFALAGYWAARALLERLDRQLERSATYPNEWGVRIVPLTPAETAAAAALEAAIADGTIDSGAPSAGK